MSTSFGWVCKCMVHSVSGCTWGVQLKLWDPLRTRAIPERLRGVFTTRRYTNPHLPLRLRVLSYWPWTSSVAVQDVCPASLAALMVYLPASASVRSHSLNVYTPSAVDDSFTLSLSSKSFPSRLLQTVSKTDIKTRFVTFFRYHRRSWHLARAGADHPELPDRGGAHGEKSALSL